MKDIKEWANQNKLKALFILCILSVVVANYLHFLTSPPTNPPVQTEEAKAEVKKQEDIQVKKQETLKIKQVKDTKTTIRTYDKETGKIVKEVVKETSSKKELAKDVELEKTAQNKTEQKTETKTTYKKPYTGITTGIVVTPSGAGVVAGATLVEMAPITASVQIGVLVQPEHSVVAGLSVNGEVATNLEAGVGVYLGPQTSFGYTPVPGLPVSIQPGITLQYRF